MRYFLFFLVTIPCQAQYLEFSAEESDVGGYTFTMTHELYKNGSDQRIILFMIGQSAGVSCRPDPEVIFSITNVFSFSRFEPAARLWINDERAINLYKEFQGFTDAGLSIMSYKVTLTYDDLMEMNDYNTTFEISGYQLPQIRSAIDEYLRRILALPECQ